MCFLKSYSPLIVINSLYIIDNYYFAVKICDFRLKITTGFYFFHYKVKITYQYSAHYLYTNHHLNQYKENQVP